MCAETVAADSNLPTAYMYSILFMLAMPAIIFTSFGVVIYRAIKKHQTAQTAAWPPPESIPCEPDARANSVPGLV